MKINGKQINAEEFAYDNCHKIYIIENEEDRRQAVEYGYDIYPIEDLEKAYTQSCELRFISNWSLNKQYVEQFVNAVFEYGEV